MDKKDKVMIVGLIIVLFLILINIFSTIHAMHDYKTRKENGNDRWKQVENRILQIEESVNELEEKKQWKN